MSQWEEYDLETENDLEAHDLEPLELPHRFTPRDYQAELIDEFFDMLEGDSEVIRFLLVWHRRAGKDVSLFQCIVAAACMEVGDYFYLLPQSNQARRVVWNGIVMDSEGVPCKFKDYIPPEMLAKSLGQEMRFELTNGSNIYIGGSDNYDNFVGGNAKGIMFSEWSLCNPLARDYFKPMINANNGWELFCFTPRGKNHAYQTYLNAQKEAVKHLWFTSRKDVTETKKENGQPIVTREQIEIDIAEGMDEDTAKQEYYLDFEAQVKGVIYSKELKRLRDEGRVKSIDIDPDVPVISFWDIGISKGNQTSAWLMQPCQRTDRLNIVGYFEAEDMSFVEGAEPFLKEFCEKHNCKLGMVYFPHDGANREWVGGKKRHEEIRELGYQVTVLPRTPDVWLGIRQTKALFSRFVFHEVYCGFGLLMLEGYSRKLNKVTGMLGDPLHDDCSNAADSLRQIGQFYADGYRDERHDKVKQEKNMVTLKRNQKKYSPLDSRNKKQGASGGYSPFKKR